MCIRWLLVLAALTLAPLSVPGATLTSDDFNDNTLSAQWQISPLGTGATLAETNARLEIALAVGATNDPSLGTFGGYLVSGCALSGDFDVSTDFDLLNWPLASGVRVGLTAIATPIPGALSIGTVGRLNLSGRPEEEFYDTHFDDGVTTSPTDDLDGRLRLTRQGNIVTGYRWDTGIATWVKIHSFSPARTDDAYIELAIWSHEGVFGNSPVLGAFDNFVVNQGVVVCTCSVLLQEATADADRDGRRDMDDRCPDTPGGQPVDDGGCSVAQFCGTFDATTSDGQRDCKDADWRNDEPRMRGRDRDCTIDRGAIREQADDTCVPYVVP